MSRGGRRRGAGRPPKTLAELKLAGTFRPGRHAALLKPAPRLAFGATAPVLDADVPPVPAEVVEGLGPAGGAFVRAAWAEAEGWSAAELQLLRLAGATLDDIQATTEIGERGKAIRVFGAVVGQLGLDRLNGRS